MPIKLIGRTTNFKGKPLWEILGNLKNFGVGRIVIRNTFQRYPEACYMKILKVAAISSPLKPHEDRKVMMLVENVFRGVKKPRPVQMDSTTYKADYMLIPKDQEHLYLKSEIKSSEKILPRTTDFPPLFAELIMQRMKTKDITEVDKPKMPLKYNFTNFKNYRVAEEGETPTVKLIFSLKESSKFYPKLEDAS